MGCHLPGGQSSSIQCSCGYGFLLKYNIQVDDWPPYSPDFTPIEHVWVELKWGLQRKYTGTENNNRGPDTVKRCLAKFLSDILKEIKRFILKPSGNVFLTERMQYFMIQDGTEGTEHVILLFYFLLSLTSL